MWSRVAEIFNPYRELGTHIDMENKKRCKRRKCKIGSLLYVLYNYWDTPNVEGNEVLGVFLNLSDAILAMKSAADSLKAEYPSDFWEEDFTWQDELEIHLGSQKDNPGYATIYCWTISEEELQ